MSPFKPSNRLSYQGPSLAIPSLEGNANDRSSALGRRLSQSSLPNIPNNKRLSGAHQENPKRLRRELPETTKADEPRVGITDGQGIETDKNSLIGSAPREAWEDEFMQYPEDNLVPQEASLANRVNSENLENLSGAPNQDSDFFNFIDELDFGNTSASFENQDAEMGLASSSEETSNNSSGEPSLDDLLFGLVSLDHSTNLLSYLDSNNLLENHNSGMSFGKKLEANHADLSTFGTQSLGGNTESKEKNKRCTSHVQWTDELSGIANYVIDKNANKNLSGIDLHKLFEETCKPHYSGLKLPSYDSFMRNFFDKTRIRVNLTDELRTIAKDVIFTYPDLKTRGQYEKFEEKCKEKGFLEVPHIRSFYKLKNSRANRKVE